MPDRVPLEMAEQYARRLGMAIGERIPEGWAFVLILATFGEEGFLTYISSAERADMIAMLRETADNLEQGKATV